MRYVVDEFALLSLRITTWILSHLPFGVSLKIMTGVVKTIMTVFPSYKRTALKGLPLSFVVRNFKLPRTDKWYQSIREAKGNRVISRTGAFPKIIKALREKRLVGLLIDQNVRREHAVFVDWFGQKAATSKSIALAALKTHAPVVVASILADGNGYYIPIIESCNLEPIYSSKELSHNDKILLITQEISTIFENMIRRYPEAWFWMHKRWRTRPSEESEDIYKV